MEDVYEHDIWRSKELSAETHAYFTNYSRDPATTIQPNVGTFRSTDYEQMIQKVDDDRYLASYSTRFLNSFETDKMKTMPDQLQMDPFKLSGYDQSKEYDRYERYDNASELLHTKLTQSASKGIFVSELLDKKASDAIHHPSIDLNALQRGETDVKFKDLAINIK